MHHRAKHLKQDSRARRHVVRDNVEAIIRGNNVLSEHSVAISPKEPTITTKVLKIPRAEVTPSAPHRRVQNNPCPLFDPARVCGNLDDTHHFVS
tara:strand:- start:1337 stop:1618 length:282 start_codon:yes stop_codon:yes gene_type:complete